MTTEQKANDLELLQREYRHMEQNRKAYAEESQQVLRKQQQTIDKLRRDNDSLKTEIAMQMRTTLKPANSFQQSMISKLSSQMDKYSSQIESEKNAISVMDEQIAVLRDKILHQRKMMGGVNAARDNQHMIQKQVGCWNAFVFCVCNFAINFLISCLLPNPLPSLLNPRFVFLRTDSIKPW